MQEVFEKIIEKLEEKARFYNSASDVDQNIRSGVIIAKNVVQEETEKFDTGTNVGSNGWISCNEWLPEGRQDVLVCFDNIDGCIIAWYSPNGRTWRNSSTNNICKAEPIAWMNLPAPYQPKGE